MRGESLPSFTSAQWDQLMHGIRDAACDPVQLQRIGARALAGMLERMQMSANAEREVALLVDASRRS